MRMENGRKPEYRCCIFDLDGTLINTLSALTKVINLTLRQFGLEPVDQEQTKVFVGDGYQQFVRRAFICRGWKETDDFSEAFSVYNECFQQHCLDGIEAYDGIRELLAYLKDKKIKIAVLSNKSQDGTTACIETVFGKGYFDLVTGERQGVPRKPNPAGVFYTMEGLGVTAEECLYFGDTNTDMETGKAAGLDTAGVTWGFRDRAELESFSPKYVVDDPREVIAILEAQ